MRKLRSIIEANRLIAVLTVIALMSFAAGQTLAGVYGARPPEIFSPFLVLFLAAIGFGGALALIVYVLLLARNDEPSPLHRVAALPYGNIAKRVAPTVLTLFFLGSFGTFKSMIPYVQPFYLDGFLSDLDRAVLGTDAWRITHAFIGPTGTRLIDLAYGLWFPAWAFPLVYFGCIAKEEDRRQFLLSFICVWVVVGVAMATILSSAGPCFLHLIHHPYAYRYDGLFPLDAPAANATQAMLAASYANGDIGAFKGISAMPSVHVAIAAVLIFAARPWKWWFAASIAFYVLILVGSVHLGWHYLSDGIVGTLAAAAIWFSFVERRDGVAAPAAKAAVSG